MTTSSLDTIKAREESLLCRTYGRYPVSIASGKGSRVTDLDGKDGKIPLLPNTRIF